MKALVLAALGAVMALILTVEPAAAQNANNPIPGVDIIVQKKPGGTAFTVATSGRDGRFETRVPLEPGFDYEIRSACRARRACPPHELTALTVNGQPARRVEDTPGETRGERNGVGIYLIGAVVLGLHEPTSVTISGQVSDVRVAAPRAVAPGLARSPGPAVDPAGTGAGPGAQALSPYAGIDIMFGGGKLSQVVGTTGRDGRFAGRIEVAPGEYEVTAACPPGSACPPFRLTSVRIDGRAVAPDARGRFVVPIRPGVRSVMLEANSALQEVSTTR
jgi:hypothetical protein